MIHIACNIDANFTEHCAVTLVSLFENNRSSSFCVHIVAEALPEADQKVLTEIAEDYNNMMRFYFPDKNLLSDFSIKKFGKRISMATYYRCMFSSILPRDVDKVLYLDCDIVVLGDITEYWNTNITNYAVACVEDIGSNEKERYEILKYDSKYSYFNAGVLLINLDYWRKHEVDRQCVLYFSNYPERIRFNDQDLLNAVLHQSKVFVPLKWNMQDGFYRFGINLRVQNWENLKQELLHPVILHYTNKKPWNYDSMHPLKGEYFKYLNMTPWKGKHSLSSLKEIFLRCIKFLPYKIGLRKPKYIRL